MDFQRCGCSPSRNQNRTDDFLAPRSLAKLLESFYPQEGDLGLGCAYPGRVASPAATCHLVPSASIRGWNIDVWELSDESVAALATAYQRLLRPEALGAVLAMLDADGVNTRSIFFSEEGADEDNLARVTRADMLEIAAAASMLAGDGVPIETLVMPNVPKGSTRQSSPGIDVLASNLDPDGDPEELGPKDVIFIGSVKHTVANISQMRTKLADSVSERDLSVPYLTAQLRVYHGKLHDSGIAADRIFLLLKKSPILDPSHVRIIAVGALEANQWSALQPLLSSNYESSPNLRRFRVLLVRDISRLQTAGRS